MSYETKGAQKPLVILDLDETLIHSTYDNEQKLDGYTKIKDEDGLSFQIRKRPGLDLFLKFCFEFYNVAIWTASGRTYAMPAIKFVFGDLVKQLKFIYTAKETVRKISDSWLQTTQINIKPLTKVWKRKKYRNLYTKKNTIIVDDTPITFCRNYGNAIKIDPYSGESDDKELLRICHILKDCLLLDDVRCRKSSQGSLIIPDK